MNEKKTEVILVRHGETDYNHLHRFQGSCDIPLNDKGRTQAGYAKEALKDLHFDAIYASPLKRAFETAEIIRGDRDMEIIPEDGFRELCAGIWEEEAIDKVVEDYPEQFSYWMNDPDKFCVEGGETFLQVQERATDAFWKVVERHRGERILIASHMICLDTILLGFADLPFKEIWNHIIGNAGLNLVEVGEGRNQEIILWNDERHIPEEDRLSRPFKDYRD